jgi:hypothetical protein
MLYLLTTGDQQSANRWWRYIEDNQYLMCPDDCGTDLLKDYCGIEFWHGVFVSTEYWDLFRDVWQSLRLTVPSAMSDWATFGDRDRAFTMNSYSRSTDGWRRHLVATELFIEQIAGAPGGEDVHLLETDPTNPFFRFLHEGASETVAQETLDACGSFAPQQVSGGWKWMGADMTRLPGGWDCIFMINLMLGSDMQSGVCFDQAYQVCDANGWCHGQPKPAGTACDDGLHWTSGDHCDGFGDCVGKSYYCPEVSTECYTTGYGGGDGQCVREYHDGMTCGGRGVCEKGRCVRSDPVPNPRVPNPRLPRPPVRCRDRYCNVP